MKEFRYAPPPAFSPERDHSWLTEGQEIARVARLLGITLMPWQQHVADIATEYRLDDEGRRCYHYRTVLITVPRQSGKTTLMAPVRVHRILTRPGIDAFSTAQTGKAARDRILKLVELTESSPIAGLFKSLRSNGSEGLRVLGTNSTLTRFSPVTGALHGATPHYVDFDEIWRYTAELGDMLLGGARPGMITLGSRAQVWMISTKGTPSSTFMNRYIEAGEQGTDPTLAYFAWEKPAHLDLDDPATWWTYHPALGNTITEEDLAAEMYAEGMSYSERVRAYANQISVTEEAIIDAETWVSLATEPAGARPGLSDVAIGVEVAAGNACSAVVAAWRDAEGDPCVRVLHHAPGTTWVVPYLRNLQDYGVSEIAADDAGPVRLITDQLDPLEGDDRPTLLPVTRLSLRDRQTADVTLISAARDERCLHHDGSLPLAQAVAAAQVRTHNGVQRVDRDRSLGPVAALIAASVALYAYDHHIERGDPIQIW